MRPVSRSRLNIIKKREGEPWIYSYADLVTNLLAFFMMMLVVMTSSQQVRQDFVEGLKNYVNSKAANGPSAARDVPVETTVPEVKQVIEKYIQESQLADQVSLSESLTGIELTFEGALLFDTANAAIRPEASDVLARIGQVIAKLPERFVLDVEGHADPRPIAADSRYPSNWELSSARAGSVVRFLESQGLAAKRLRAIGYAATKPLDDRIDAEINRRVVVKVNSRWD